MPSKRRQRQQAPHRLCTRLTVHGRPYEAAGLPSAQLNKRLAIEAVDCGCELGNDAPSSAIVGLMRATNLISGISELHKSLDLCDGKPPLATSTTKRARKAVKPRAADRRC